MRFRKYSQSNDGFVALVPLLVVALFALTVVVTLHQRQVAQARALKKALDVRLTQELGREIQRLRSLPGQRHGGDSDGELPIRALDNLRRRALDQMLDLEGRRARLRQLARRAHTQGQKKAARRSLRGLDQDINLARFWILMIEARQKQFRLGVEPPPTRGVPRLGPSGKAPKSKGTGSNPPAIPDWW